MIRFVFAIFLATSLNSFAGVGGMEGTCSDKKTTFRFERMKSGGAYWCQVKDESGDTSISYVVTTFSACRFKVCGKNDPNASDALEEQGTVSP